MTTIFDQMKANTEAAGFIDDNGSGSTGATYNPFPSNLSEIIKGDDGDGTDPDERAAALSREQYQDYLKRFVPIEDQLISQIFKNNKITGASQQDIDQALFGVNQSAQASVKAQNRDFERYGIGLGGDRAKVRNRTYMNDVALNRVNAANNVRNDVKDMNVGLANEVVGLGRGIAADATSIYGSASAAAKAREAQNDALAAQQKAADTSALIGLAGLGIGIAGLV